MFENELIALGYVGIRSSRLEDWESYATGLLGMQQVDRGGQVRTYRMDDRAQRLVVTNDEGDGLAFLGWEAADGARLDILAARLEANDVPVRRASRGLAAERRVTDLIWFHDPAGNRLEVFHGPEIATDPFQPGRPISGFQTGPLGMGHVVLNVVDVDRLVPFYRDLLGFRLTDYGLVPYKLFFFHLNNRHHSFAMIGSGRQGLHHFMVEVSSLDDVGQGYDLAQLQENRIAYTLGRHTNDYMTSFYSHTPSGFFVEYGWGGRSIDPVTWQPHETHDGPSFWGHERLYMDAAGRSRLRDMRLSAAARGVRAPLNVERCAWLDGISSVK